MIILHTGVNFLSARINFDQLKFSTVGPIFTLSAPIFTAVIDVWPCTNWAIFTNHLTAAIEVALINVTLVKRFLYNEVCKQQIKIYCLEMEIKLKATMLVQVLNLLLLQKTGKSHTRIPRLTRHQLIY